MNNELNVPSRPVPVQKYRTRLCMVSYAISPVHINAAAGAVVAYVAPLDGEFSFSPDLIAPPHLGRRDCADLAQANLDHDPVEPGARDASRGRAAEIIVDGLDGGPAERHQAVAHRIFQGAALAVVRSLMGRGLPQVEDLLALQMMRPDLLCIVSRLLPPTVRAVGVVEDQADHQPGKRWLRLDGQAPPVWRRYRSGAVRQTEEAEFLRCRSARHGHLPESHSRSSMLRPKPAIPMARRSFTAMFRSCMAAADRIHRLTGNPRSGLLQPDNERSFSSINERKATC